MSKLQAFGQYTISRRPAQLCAGSRVINFGGTVSSSGICRGASIPLQQPQRHERRSTIRKGALTDRGQEAHVWIVGKRLTYAELTGKASLSPA
jgi:hypothetical protein